MNSVATNSMVRSLEWHSAPRRFCFVFDPELVRCMRIFALTILIAACSGSPSNPCDSAQLSLACSYMTGECVEFTGLSTEDHYTTQAGCRARSGTELTGSCPTAGRLGTCIIPPTGSVTCSPSGHVAIRFFAPFTQAGAKTACDGIAGSTWTAN